MADRNEMTIHSILQSFKDVLENYESEENSLVMGDRLEFPMLIVYLGTDGAVLHENLMQRLSGLWPQSRNDFRFVSVTGTKESPVYRELQKNGNVLPADAERLQAIIDKLQGNETQFRDFSKLYVYYFLNTGDFQKASDLSDCFALSEQFKADARLSAPQEFFGILLDERTSKFELARTLRSELFEMQHALGENARNILLVSNYLKNNARLKDWTKGYDALVDFIALSNRRTEYENPLAKRGVKAVGITREEKPVDEIGREVVLGMIEYLKQQEKAKPFELTAEKLGVNENGTFCIFDDYAVEKVPKAEDLDVFPRPDADFYEMETLSYTEFNNQSLGAWDAYLSGLVTSVKDELSGTDDFCDRWRNLYRNVLTAHFRTNEIALLSRHLPEIREYFSKAREPKETEPVLEVAVEKVGYLIASDRKVREMMLGEILEASEEAEQFLTAWNTLYEDRYELGVAGEANVSQYYRSKVKYLCALKGIEDGFFNLKSPDGLKPFFEGWFREFIQSEDIFRASFDVELAKRMEETGDAQNARDYIREKLLHSNTTQFLTTTLPLSMPIVSTVFVKRDSELHKNLRKNLPEEYGYTYYDTGISNYAEAIYVYDVPADYLLN